MTLHGAPQSGGREPTWRRYLRLLRPDVAVDVDDELRFHLEMRVREYEAQGLPTADASRAARERFGDVEAVGAWLRTHDRRRERASHRRETMGMTLQQLRYAFRSLRRQPAFTTAVVLTLALGIGAMTAIFGVVNGVLLKPLPYPDAERLVALSHTSPAAPGTPIGQSQATYATYRQLNRTLAEVGLHQEVSVNVTDGTTPERVPADSATASVFSALHVKPLLGRTFTGADEQPGHAPVVLISEGIWRRRFGGASDVIGRHLRVDDVLHEVIGVMPASFHFPRAETQLWMPLALDPSDPNAGGGFNFVGLGRLRPGVTAAAAAQELERLLPRMPELFPIAAPGMPMERLLAMIEPRPDVHALRDDVVGDVGRVLWVIFGTIAFVLLAACANIANLCLVRAEGRQRELAVRAALGAGRRDVLARFLAEGVILAGLGGALGVALAAAGLHVLRRTSAVPIPRLAEVGVDTTVLAVTALLTVGVALVASVLPMMRFGLHDLASLLRAGGRAATHGRERRRVQRTLVVTQVALAFVLLAASTLMARTFVELRRVQPGFDAERALVFRIAPPAATYRDRASVLRFHDQLRDRLTALPAVDAVGVTSWLPLEQERSAGPLWVEGDASPQQDAPPIRPIVWASAGYFRSLGIPLLAGSAFGNKPPDQSSDEVVVSAAFAAQVFDDPTGRLALGRRVRLLESAPWLTIVGVAGNVRHASLDREPPPVVYLPLNTQGYGEAFSSVVARQVTVIVRTSGEPAALAPAVRREIAALDPGLPVFQLRPMQAVVRRSMARTSFTALLLGLAAAVALALGVVGLYGVVAYTVGTRRREIGLRIALGAPPGAVSRMFARQGATLAAVGVGAGIVGAVLVTRLLRALLYGVSPGDPLMLGGAAVLLLGVAFGASWIPARRAARVDPATVLSTE